MTPEGKVKAEIKKWLHEQGAYWHMPITQGYGAATLDFLVCLHGRFLGVETKRKGVLNPTPRQAMVIKQIQEAGGRAYCVDSLEMLVEKLRP